MDQDIEHTQFYIKRIEGRVDDPFSGAWEKLNDWALETDLTFKKKDGREVQTAITFIDSGDGVLTEVVYRFCNRWNSTYPIKGRKKIGSLDKASESDFRRYKPSKINEDTVIYIISTNFYKNVIYNNLKIKRTHSVEIQSPGFSDFPVDRPEKYFKMLTAEEKLNDGSFYCPSGKRNEALDCRCYAICAADVYLDVLVEKYRKSYKSKGAAQDQISQVNQSWVIKMLKAKMGVED